MSAPLTADPRAAWTVRPSQPGDVPGVLRLFAEAFRRPVSEHHYRWKVLDSPWPVDAPTVWLASAGERVVGHYGGTPLRFQVGGRVLRALHGCDVMTAPEYRRRGVLTAVGDAAHAAWSAAGVSFVIGLPTAAWGSRRQRLGCLDAFPLAWLRRPLRPEALLARRLGSRSPALPVGALAGRAWNHVWDTASRRAARGVEVAALERPGPELDLLWERLRAGYDALVVRDRAWVSYRYADAPEGSYRLLIARRSGLPTGYLAYRVTSSDGRRSGWIADLFSAPGDGATRAALLRTAVDRIRSDGAEEVRALAAPATPLFGSLRRAGFLRHRGTYEMVVIPLAGDVPTTILRDPGRTLVAGGDFDVL